MLGIWALDLEILLARARRLVALWVEVLEVRHCLAAIVLHDDAQAQHPCSSDYNCPDG